MEIQFCFKIVQRGLSNFIWADYSTVAVVTVVAETVVVVVTDVVVAETVVGLPEQIHHLQVQPVGAAVVAVIGVKLTPINI